MAKKKRDVNFIVFTDGDEVIVTTPELENEVFLDYFGKGAGFRDIDDFDREEITGNSVSVMSCGLRFKG